MIQWYPVSAANNRHRAWVAGLQFFGEVLGSFLMILKVFWTTFVSLVVPWAHFGHPWALLGHPWALLGHPWALLGRPWGSKGGKVTKNTVRSPWSGCHFGISSMTQIVFSTKKCIPGACLWQCVLFCTVLVRFFLKC